MKKNDPFHLTFETCLYGLLLITFALLPFYGFSAKNEAGISEPPLMKTLYSYILMGGISILAFIKMRPSHFNTNWAERAALPVLLWGGVSLIWTEKLDYTLYELLLIGIIISSYFVMRWLLHTPERIETLLWVIHVAAFFASLIGVIQYLIDPDFMARGRTQVASVFGNKNLAMHYLVLSLPVGLWLTLKQRDDWRVRVVAAVALLANILFITYSGTRSAYVALLLPSIILTAVVFWKHFKGHVAFNRADYTVFAGFVLLYVVLLGASSVGFSPIVDAVDPARGTSGRTCIWESTLHMIQVKPLLGWGLGSYEYVNYVHDSCGRPVQRVHNEYLQAAMELGIIGFLFSLLFLVVATLGLLKRAWREIKSEQPNALNVMVFCVFLATGTQSLFTFPYELHYNALVMVALLAMSSALSASSSKAHEKDTVPFMVGKGVWGAWIAFAIICCFMWLNEILTYSRIFQDRIKSLSEIEQARPWVENPMINEVALHALTQKMSRAKHKVLLNNILGDNEQSVHLIHQAAQHAISVGDKEGAIDAYEKIMENSVRTGAQTLYVRSYLFYLEKTQSYDFAKARFLRYFDQVKPRWDEKRFFNTSDQIAIANISLRYGKPQQTIKMFNELNEESPSSHKTDHSISLLLGLAHDNLGQHEQALKWFETFIQYFPNHPNAAGVRQAIAGLKQKINQP